jgi:hypothetical protein
VKRTKPTKTCPTCGRTFYHSQDKVIHCSRECYQPQSPEHIAARFWSKVEFGDGCWMWRAGISSSGYGAFKAGGKQYRAHKFAYELMHGLAPAGMFVCHKCDTPACVRPGHLFLGTPKDNLQDCKRKGRTSRGELSPRATLTVESVRAIRAMRSRGQSYKQIALAVRASIGAVSHVLNGRVWTHVQ